VSYPRIHVRIIRIFYINLRIVISVENRTTQLVIKVQKFTPTPAPLSLSVPLPLGDFTLEMKNM
jgi:hypothetical protein